MDTPGKNLCKDPLIHLPAEMVLKIIDYTDISDVPTFARLSRTWKDFTQSHEDHIYAAKAEHLPSLKKPADYKHTVKSFARFYDDVRSWKELCQRQVSLKKNWNGVSVTTSTRESILQTGATSVWRFRPDFSRRLIMSTSQRGGIQVFSMDTGKSLWTLPRDNVRPYAHLEYAEDMSGHAVAVWDRWGNGLEVWRSTQEGGGQRGVFERVALLEHNFDIRGFQLSYNTLCVVSTEGKGLVYDMLQSPPRLAIQHPIQQTPVGHLDQNEECVMYSLGQHGYHIYSKATGDFLGVIEPWTCSATSIYRIEHPKPEPNGLIWLNGRTSVMNRAAHGPTPQTFPPENPSTERLLPIAITQAPALEQPARAALSSRAILQQDDWGAGILHGNLMVGVSRHGRVVIVRNWRESLCRPTRNDTDATTASDTTPQESSAEESETQRAAAAAFAANTDLILCTPHEDSQHFDFGGWLSVRDGRIACEIRDRIYMIALNRDDTVPVGSANQERKSYALASSSAPEIASPVSFMALFDDCLAHTYTTLGQVEGHPGLEQRSMVRMVSFAPQ